MLNSELTYLKKKKRERELCQVRQERLSTESFKKREREIHKDPKRHMDTMRMSYII